MTQEQKKYLKEISRCELCGSPKALELHHIIPTAFGGPDVKDNWIAICSGCHGKLTPRGLLISMGMKGDDITRKPILDFRDALLRDLEDAKRNEDYFSPDFDWMFEKFLDVFWNPERPVVAFYKEV